MSFRYTSYLIKIADYAGSTDPAKVGRAIHGKLQRIGLGFVPVPSAVAKIGLFVGARIAGPLARFIDFATLIPWRLGIARHRSAPYYVELKLLAAGRTDDAIEFCREFFAKQRNAWSVAQMLVELYLASGRTRDAVALIREMSLRCDSPSHLLGIGRRLIAFCAASDMLQQTARPGTQADVTAHMDSLQAGEPCVVTARRCFYKVVAATAPADDLHRRACYWRGMLSIQAGLPEEAEADLAASIARGPGFAMAYAFLSDIYEARGATDLALKHLKRAVAEGFERLPILERMCRLQMSTGDIDGALVTAGKIADGVPNAIVAEVE